MKSVLLLMEVKDIAQYKQWYEKGYPFNEDDIERWALATILNVYDLAKIVSKLNFLNINFTSSRICMFT